MTDNADNIREVPQFPRFCAGCPLIPDGVAAVLTGAEMLTMSALRGFRFAREAPELAEPFAGDIRITAEAVSSDKPGVDPGDTARLLIRLGDEIAAADVARLITDCPGPQRTRLRRLAGTKGTCGCLGSQPLRRI